MTKVVVRTVHKDDHGARLDRWFKRHYPGLSHGILEKLLRTGQVRLEGARAKASDRVEAGQTIRVPPMKEGAETARPSKTEATLLTDRDRIDVESLVLYEDSEVFVLNKPPGLASQGGPGITKSVDSLLGALQRGRKQRPRLVHRLDKDTSGVLLIARTVPAAAALSEAFRARETRKVYWAMTKGVPKPGQGTIKGLLAKVAAGGGPREERVVIAAEGDDDAKRAITHYRVMDSAAQTAAFVALMPVTGRTHQLRAHMASIGTPIAGDFKYGGEGARLSGLISQKMHLHARSLRVRHPTRGWIDVSAPLPPHMLKSWSLFGWDEALKGDPFAGL